MPMQKSVKMCIRDRNKALLKANQSLGEKTKSLDEKCQTLAKEYKELGEHTLIKRIEYEALEIAAETIKKASDYFVPNYTCLSINNQ